jgi:hypothetical protein
MREGSAWTRFRQGIHQDFHRGIDRVAYLHGLSWRTVPQMGKVLLLFTAVSLLVTNIIYVSGVQFQFLRPHMSTLLGALLGFISGWGLFEIGEERRRRRQQRTIREALKAELRNMERVLNQLVFKFAYGAIDPGRGVQEMRWFFSKGLQQSIWLGDSIPADFSPEVILQQSDEALAQWLRQFPPQQPNTAVDLPMPVLQAALAAPTSGFTSLEIQRLSWVRWQAHLLAHEAQMMKEMVMLTFTVNDADNHRSVTDNVETAKQGYRMRAGYTLDAVREALKTIEN